MITTPEEKSDFRELAKDDYNPNCFSWYSIYASGCDKIWTDYVIPLQKELKEREEQWISINEKIPLTQERVLVYGQHWSGVDGPFTAVFINEPTLKWYGNGEYLKDVTHWMPLPSPPKTVKDK